jgi:hypothetical protein
MESGQIIVTKKHKGLSVIKRRTKRNISRGEIRKTSMLLLIPKEVQAQEYLHLNS